MELFVNRETELQVIDNAFQTLLDKTRLLRTPIIEFSGVGGIGKTSLLKQVEERCNEKKLQYLWVDVGRDPARVDDEIITQTRKYIPVHEDEEKQSPILATRALLQQGPVVLLLDSVDTANKEQQEKLVSLLRNLIDHEKFFVILTSQKLLPFDQERSVARKLSTFSLKSFNRKHCESYLIKQNIPIDTELRDLVFEWTRGYPLAMNIMTQALNDGIDPRTDEGRDEMLNLLMDKVIDQGVLANTQADERDNYRALLQLLAIPRRFNLPIMQDLIEKFIPHLRRERSMAYFGLPGELNATTNVVNWNFARAGYCVDEPIRSLFLLLLKMQHLDNYLAIHSFLAQLNQRLAGEQPGFDRVRYTRECLYHIACSAQETDIAQQLEEGMQLMLQESLENFQQFTEEFAQDQELKEALGDYLIKVQSIIAAHIESLNNDDHKDSRYA
ncbi:hypothetical protein KDA_68880 [Dictyobacter alpinus]|uniref:NB-ARC domain-containing protein n=1 Tax=Dictyobacter alpinus TaxID=2014873 RepID=A0A402BJ33_9CHLR|nr:ATP-binding protein [Dictyobacter alpinus]GCE31404.1 hypothetical protein KDA_68880 [Dictyobacter alpinus]